MTLIPRQTLHASTVAVDGRGLLILGPSGAGKSALAIRLLALGAALVADDCTELAATEAGRIIARCPTDSAGGIIEARGIGLLRAPRVDHVEVVLAIDLGQPEPDRLPPRRQITILGCALALVLRPQNDHFPDALMLHLRHGRQA